MPTCRPYGGTNVPLPSGTWSLGDTPTGGRLGGGVRLPVGGLEREEPVRQVDTEAKGGNAGRCAEWPRQRGAGYHLVTFPPLP